MRMVEAEHRVPKPTGAWTSGFSAMRRRQSVRRGDMIAMPHRIGRPIDRKAANGTSNVAHLVGPTRSFALPTPAEWTSFDVSSSLGFGFPPWPARLIRDHRKSDVPTVAHIQALATPVTLGGHAKSSNRRVQRGPHPGGRHERSR